MLTRLKLFALAGALLAVLGVAACTQDDSAEEKQAIVFSDLNWTSAQIQNRIAQYIVEEGYGYPTDVVFGATIPLFQGLRRGDSHVTMEIWLPNQDEAWEEAQTAGKVVSLGESLGKDWQSSFVIPAYLAEQYPDLDNVEDLKEAQYKELFATAETGGKARLVSCVIGWACEEVNAKQIESYGLSDHVHVVNPGDGPPPMPTSTAPTRRTNPGSGTSGARMTPRSSSTSCGSRSPPTPTSAGSRPRPAHMTRRRS